MNREIKFRGKCSPKSKYKGEWVTGSLVIPEQIQDNEVLIVVAHSDSCKSTYHVDKDTIGQYTGQQDVNKKDIYEADIFEVLNTPGMYAVVEWNSVINAMCIRFKDEENCSSITLGEILSILKIVVIGNIYDNPELIKKIHP